MSNSSQLNPGSEDIISEAANRFVQAIAWGEHVVVWQMLSEDGRQFVLEAGGRRGLDPLQAERLRQGTSPQDELDSFLTGLLHGLRVDFSAVPLDEVRAVSAPTVVAENRVEVSLSCPANFGEGQWAAGTLVMSLVSETWFVDRVQPLVSRSE